MAMDIQQIRSSFLGAESLLQRLKGFKAERIGEILARNNLYPQGKAIIHVMPLETLG
jgi:hypothetical protein